MTQMMNEAAVEELAIDYFKSIGYQYHNNQDISPTSSNALRTSNQEVMIISELKNSLVKINPELDDSIIDEAIDKLKNTNIGSLIPTNKAIHKLFLNGIKIVRRVDDQDKIEIVKLIDFNRVENNRFLIVNQYTIQTQRGNRRPDIVVFLNGLPISVIELKNPLDISADIYKAYNQLQTYKREMEELFYFNVALVISDGIIAKVGSLSATKERFMNWRTIQNENDQPTDLSQLEVLIKGFFDKKLLLDYIQNFILFEEITKSGQTTTIKKIAGYHQFHGARQAVDRVIAASAKTGDKKGGVFWHTQGSGKSISMACFVGKLIKQPIMKNPTVVVVTDRNDLDNQLFGTFSDLKELLGQEIEQATTVEDIKSKLKNRSSGGIIFTTIQRFRLSAEESRFPVLNTRDNIVVVADEAHRSQYGFDAMIDQDGSFKYGYAQHLRDALPKATFIGFTGTPIENDDRDTRNVFGDYVSIYDIEKAVQDGITVPIYYQNRLDKLGIDESALQEIESYFDQISEETERETLKRKWSAMEKILAAPARIKTIAQDIISHYEERTKVLKGKAIIVAMSREIAVNLYDQIIALKPEWHDEDVQKGNIKVMMTGSASDPEHMQKHLYSSNEKKELENRFKSEDDSLQVVIVRDMWLTGFDAPCLHTMYVDKPMKSHNLMQAIARVNRVFKDKTSGLIVDYLGILKELNKALDSYTVAGGRGKTGVNTEQAYDVFMKYFEIIQDTFHGFDYTNFKTDTLRLLTQASNFILSDKEKEKRFSDAILAATKAFSICNTLEKINQYKEEFAFFQAVRIVMIKASRIDNPKEIEKEDQENVIQKLFNKVIYSEYVENLFSDFNVSNIFDRISRKETPEHLGMTLLEKLLLGQIKSKTKNNISKEKEYRERLEKSLKEYHDKHINLEEITRILFDLKNEIDSNSQSGNDIYITAFYDALVSGKTIDEIEKDKLKSIAKEITKQIKERIRNSTDWNLRETLKADMKLMLQATLLRNGLDVDSQNIELIMNQAEAFNEDPSWISA
jgi:type I restriction enzyme R subunit